MKPTLRKVFLTRAKDAGFTLTEVTVVMVVISMLAAIALPSYLNQANKAKQTEAKLNLGTLNRAQQAYFLEHYTFAPAIADLGVIVPDSSNYQYSITISSSSNTPYAVQNARSLSSTLRPYVGMSGIVQTNGGVITATILCEAEQPQQGTAQSPVYNSSALICDNGTQPLQ